MSNKTYIIAEAGVNHNGQAELAFKLVDLASAAGADAIKFQTFKTESLVTKSAKKAEYQTQTTDNEESQYQMLKQLELSDELHHQLFEYAKGAGVDFISTPYDMESLDFLVDDLKLETIKLSSGDLTNAPLLYEVGKKHCKVILSTGMGTMDEISAALGMLLIGHLDQEIKEPLFEYAKQTYRDHANHQYLKNYVSVLHCTSEYPASYEDINLQAMDTIRDEFGLTTGLSDHSEGVIIPVAAVARGATIIEKHITLDKTFAGPDHQASLSPEELHNMVTSIRHIESALGDGNKQQSRKAMR